MLKRTLSAILALAMLCTLVPTAVFAEEEVAPVAIEEATEVEVEETATEDEVTEEDVLEPMRAKNPFDTTGDNSAIVPEGIVWPETISEYGYTAADFQNRKGSADNLPKDSITYMLIDSATAAKTNFDAVLNPGTSWNNTVQHAWLTGSNQTRKSDAVDPSLVSTHTAYINVPESVGPEGKEFQIATMTIRTNVVENVGRYSFSGSRGAYVYVDDVPVSVSQENGKIDVLGNMFNHHTAKDLKLVDWTNSQSSYFIWDWSATVNLTPGVHKIVFKPAGGGSGGRIPGMIVTDAIGYDWTKVVPLAREGAIFSNVLNQIQRLVNESFGAAGYIDFAGPVFDEGIVVDKKDATLTSVKFKVPVATDMNGDVEGPYNTVRYTVEANGKEAEISEDGMATVEGLLPDSECEVVVTAYDAVGNSTELKGTVKTLGPEDVDHAFFMSDAKLSNLIDPSSEDAKTTIDLAWTEAVAGADKVVTYNVYKDGVKIAENVEKAGYTIDGLSEATAYKIKVVTCVDGVEATSDKEAATLEGVLYTSRTPEISLVGEAAAEEATLELSGVANASDFEFALKEVVVNGVDAIKDCTLNKNKVTVKNLVPGAKNTIIIKTIEKHVETKVEVSSKYYIQVVTAEADTTQDVTYDTTGLYKYTAPVWYGTLPDNNKWATNPNDPDGNSSDFGFSKSEYWYGAVGTSHTATVDVLEGGEYFAYASGFAYDPNRYVTASVNGTALGFNFMKADSKNGEGLGSILPESKGYKGGSLCPTPITLSKGNATVKLTVNGGLVRVEQFVLIPVCEDTMGVTSEELKELTADQKYEKAIEFATKYLKGKASMLKFFTYSDILSPNSLSAKVMSNDSFAVSWNPAAAFASDASYVFNVYLDGELVASVDPVKVAQYAFNGVAAGAHKVKVECLKDGKENTSAEISVNVGDVSSDYSTVTETVDGEEHVKTVTAKLSNLTASPVKMGVLVATYEGNRIIDKDYVPGIDVDTTEDVILNLTTGGVEVPYNQAVNAAKKQVKIFFFDEAKGFVPAN